jgi:hypothetical protein
MKKDTREKLTVLKDLLYEVSATLYDEWTSEELKTAKLVRITVGKELDLVNNAIASINQALELVETRELRNWNVELYKKG